MSENIQPLQWVSFYINNEIYAESIDDIREIIPYQPPIPVPGSPTEVDGILNVRGEIVTTISSRSLLGMPAKKPNEEWRIIILESELGLIGLCVEGVGEILSFAEEQIEIAANQNCIKGTIQLNEQLVIVMNTLSKVRSLSLELAEH